MLGNEVGDDEVDQLIAEADVKQTGHIDKEEFLEMMRQRQDRARSTLRASMSSRDLAIPPIPPPEHGTDTPER